MDGGAELVPQPAQVGAVVGVVVAGGRWSMILAFNRRKVATQHPAVALEVLAGVDSENLAVTDEVNGRSPGARVAVRHLTARTLGTCIGSGLFQVRLQRRRYV
jgi:hypothetical protein